jgi:hypothetical protein
MRVWRLLGEYNAESKTYSALAGTAQTSPYTPDFSGALVGIRVIGGADGVTTKTEHVQFKMTCTTFQPNVLHVGFGGGGIRTAPAFQPVPLEWPISQRVQSGVPIDIEARNVTADTPVGVDVFLYGLFQVGK